MYYLINFILLFLCINNVLCNIDGTCSFTTCGACISSPEVCVWCKQDDINLRDRCKPQSNSKDYEWCKEENIINPNGTMEIVEEKKFHETINGVQVQFTPQRIKMRVRPGVTQNFYVEYKPAQHFPLDIYFLMDISFTMLERVNEVTSQAKKIQQELQKYTNNVKLGLGTFVEKPGFPYVDQNARHKSHAFHNHVNLTFDMNEFAEKIPTKENFGANYDDPEAGLDALMQVMLCHEEIGWRNEARRIIVLCTDSTYHSAGDGKMIGIIEPNDMECHYKNGTFKTEMTKDYPSVSQIKKIAFERNFMIIFAATNNVKNDYNALAKELVNAEYAEQKNEGGTVLTVIKTAYEKMRSQAKMDKVPLPFVSLTSDQDCQNNIRCEIKHDSSIKVNWNLTVTSCPPTNLAPPYQVVIQPAGLSEKLIIDLEVICKCEECEKDVLDHNKFTTYCHNVGELQCGVCKCDDGRYGYRCQCNGTTTDIAGDSMQCRYHANDTNLCNGHGHCVCGKCEECNINYSGEFCQFNDQACPMVQHVLCAGHGKCVREKCECDLGWSGDSCNCPKSHDSCKAPYSNDECSGHGDCICGKCVCHQHNNESYWGDFCDDCDECADKRCKELEKYVLCNYKYNQTYCDIRFNNKSNNKEDKSALKNNNMGNTIVTKVNQTEINAPKYYMAKRCSALLDDGNYVIFKYFYIDNNLNLVIQNEPEMAPVANLLIAIGSAVGAVLLIGLATIVIWKILVDLHDKREYEKFAAESEAEGYDVRTNVIYQPAAVNFVNPTFNEHD